MLVGAPGEGGFQFLVGNEIESLGWASGYRSRYSATGGTVNLALVRGAQAYAKTYAALLEMDHYRPTRDARRYRKRTYT